MRPTLHLPAYSLPRSLLLLLCCLSGCLWLGAQGAGSPDEFPFSTIELDEVTVKAPLRDIELVGDTTVIHVDAFKTPAGSRLEDLIARIPGMRYDRRTGSLYYNEELLREVNINGRTLDLGSIATALETIPVEILSRLKIYDKATELENFSGFRTRAPRSNMVLDLATRADFESMFMVNTSAAQGSEHKHGYSADGNRFDKDGDNFNLLARSGNLEARSAYPRNRTDLLNASTNFTPKEKLRVAARVSYSHDINGSQSSSAAEQYLLTGNRWQVSSNDSRFKSHSFNSTLSVTDEISPSTFLQVGGSYDNFGNGSTNSTRQASFNGDPGLDTRDPFSPGDYDHVDRSKRLNEMKQQGISDYSSRNASASTSLMKMFNDKHTGLSLSANYNYGRSRSKNFSLSRTTYYELRDLLGNDSVLLRNQYRLNPTLSHSYNLQLTFSHQLSDPARIVVQYNLKGDRQRTSLGTYDLSPFMLPEMETPASSLPEGYEAGYIDSLSNRSLTNNLSQGIQLIFTYDSEKINFMSQLGVDHYRQSLDQKTGTVRADTVRRSLSFNPQVYLSYSPGSTRFNISYYGITRQPSLSDLLTVTDNSDPLYISRGNPNLSATYNHSISLNVNISKINLDLNSRWQNTFNNVIRSTTYDMETGGVETRPVNINGNWDWNNSFNFFIRLNRKFHLSSSGSIALSNNVGLLNEGRQPEPSRSVTRSRDLSARVNLNYAPSWGGIQLMANWSHDYSRNLLRGNRNYVRSYEFSSELFASVTSALQLQGNLGYSFRNGTNIRSGDDDRLSYKLGARWRFLRKRSAELKVEWLGEVSDNKDFRRIVSTSGITETYRHIVGSYLLATLNYRFNIK